MSTPGVMMVVEQTQGYRISFELIKPNQSNPTRLCWYHDADHQLSLSTQLLYAEKE